MTFVIKQAFWCISQISGERLQDQWSSGVVCIFLLLRNDDDDDDDDSTLGAQYVSVLLHMQL